MGAMNQIDEEVVLEHMGRVAALWRERGTVVRSRVHDLVDLVALDGEMRAHLDGMEAAGEAGWELAEQRVTWWEPANVYVKLMMAGLRGDRDRLEQAVSMYLHEDSLWSALVSALGWLPAPDVAPLIDDWMEYHGARWRALALALCVAHRRDPQRAVDRGLLDDDEVVQRQGVRACGVFGCRALAGTLRALAIDVPTLRFFVARALGALGEPDAADLLWDHALTGDDHEEEASALAMRQVSVHCALSWLESANHEPTLRRVVLVGTAATGSPVCVPRLLDALEDPDVAALAGFGLQVITGLDLHAADLTSTPRSDRDPELAYPDAEGVRRWWYTHRRRFEPRARYLLGRPVDAGALHYGLLRGPQVIRLGAAYELHRLRNDYHRPFEVDAPGWRQQRWLGTRSTRRAR